MMVLVGWLMMSMFQVQATEGLATAASVAPAAVDASIAAQDPLPRRAAFGAQIETQPPDAEVRGVLIDGVIAGLSAEHAGLRSGDIVVALDGVAVEGVPLFLALLRGRRAGEALAVDFVRDGARHQVTLVLREMPRERYDDIEVVYDHIAVNGARLRTILSHPRGVTGRLPTVVVAGGVGCYSVDIPVGEPGAYARILNELTRLNYATMRVEKSGMGDSEGQPCASQSFFDEQAGYIEAVRAVRRYPFVDGDQVFLFGHSMGGVHAPLVAEAVAGDAPLAGLMVMGTVGTSWFAYEMENGRRQLPLYGVPADEVEARLNTEGRCVAALVAEKRAPDDIVGEWPECAESMQFPAHYTYRREIMDLNMPGNWRRVSVPVLAMYGASDFLTSAAEHFYIGGLVNHRNPGSATVRIVDGLDHYFRAVPSQQESVRASQGRREAEYDPRVHQELHQWMTHVRSARR
jgi:uncharacterized protein